MTLLEVMVALVIVSVAILGFAQSGAQVLKTHQALESRTFGLMVAENVLSEIALGRGVVPGRRDGQVQMANRAWYYQAVIQPTTNEALLRVDVGVYEATARDDLIVLHTGFVEP